MAVSIGRRQFMSALGSAAAWPLAAHAQQPAIPVVGFVNVASPQGYAQPLSAFLKGLGACGQNTSGRSAPSSKCQIASATCRSLSRPVRQKPISMRAVAVVAQVQIGERLKYRKYFGFVLPKWHFGRGLAL
jgi:hypothetical protein